MSDGPLRLIISSFALGCVCAVSATQSLAQMVPPTDPGLPRPPSTGPQAGPRPVPEGADRSGPPAKQPPTAKAPTPAAKPQPKDPLTALLEASDSSTKLARARLRDNLYAMLATSGDGKVAKRIAARIEKLWLNSGSDTVDVLMQRAAKATSGKTYESALKFLDAALELAPDYAEAWNRRAFVHYQSGAVRQAVGDLRRVLALDPNHFKALHGLATIMTETGDEAAAYKAYGRLLDVHPYWDGAQKAYDDLKSKVRRPGYLIAGSMLPGYWL